MATLALTRDGQKGRWIAGEERRALARELAERYAAGASVRALATSSRRSYGFVHRLLGEAGVQLRPRGGAQPRHETHAGR